MRDMFSGMIRTIIWSVTQPLEKMYLYYKIALKCNGGDFLL